jgi:hypothetical protein
MHLGDLKASTVNLVFDWLGQYEAALDSMEEDKDSIQGSNRRKSQSEVLASKRRST